MDLNSYFNNLNISSNLVTSIDYIYQYVMNYDLIFSNYFNNYKFFSCLSPKLTESEIVDLINNLLRILKLDNRNLDIPIMFCINKSNKDVGKTMINGEKKVIIYRKSIIAVPIGLHEISHYIDYSSINNKSFLQTIDLFSETLAYATEIYGIIFLLKQYPIYNNDLLLFLNKIYYNLLILIKKTIPLIKLMIVKNRYGAINEKNFYNIYGKKESYEFYNYYIQVLLKEKMNINLLFSYIISANYSISLILNNVKYNILRRNILNSHFNSIFESFSNVQENEAELKEFINIIKSL